MSLAVKVTGPEGEETLPVFLPRIPGFWMNVEPLAG